MSLRRPLPRPTRGGLLAVFCVLGTAAALGVNLLWGDLGAAGIRFQIGVVTYAIWSALTAAWVIDAGAARLRRLGEGAAGWRSVVPVLVWFAALPIPIVFFVSWVVRVATGRFLDLESLRFLLVNERLLWLHLVQTEQTRLGLAAVGAAAVAAGWGWLYRAPAGSASRDRWRRPWLAATLLAVCGLALNLHSQWLPFAPRWEMGGTTRWQVTPATALAVSLVGPPPEALWDCLPVRELTPRDDDSWSGVATAPPRSVIYVAVEALRADAVDATRDGRAVMPTLQALAREGIHFRRAYAQSTHSDYSDVSVLSSLYPLRSRRHHYYGAADPWPKRLVYDLLKEAGYATALISAQNEGWGRMDRFLRTPGLDLFFDAEVGAELGLPVKVSSADGGFAAAVDDGVLRAGKLDDAVVVQRAIDWIGERDTAPFFLALNLQSSHFPYTLEPAAPRPFRPFEVAPSASFFYYPPEQTEVVRNAYFNALAYIDGQLAKLLAALEARGARDRTLIVVYGENGEMFHENQLVTHAKDPYEAALRVALVFAAPGLLPPRAIDEPVALLDVVPTTLWMLGLSPDHPNLQGRDALAADPGPGLVFFHNEVEWSAADGVIFAGRWKLWRDRLAGAEHLYDLVSDPGERHDLRRVERGVGDALSAVVGEWRCRQLTYYQNPMYYTRYYPPPIPATPLALESLANSPTSGEQPRR